MRLTVHMDDGVETGEIKYHLEALMESLGDVTIVDQSPDYLLVYSFGRMEKTKSDKHAADIGLSGPAAVVWDESHAKIKESVNVSELRSAAPAADEPKHYRMTAEFTPEQGDALIAAVFGDALKAEAPAEEVKAAVATDEEKAEELTKRPRKKKLEGE